MGTPGETALHRTQPLDLPTLEAWLRQNIGGFEGPVTISQFAGGQSNPTFRLTTQNAAYVLRRKPAGVTLPSAHAVDREFRVLSAMRAAGVPVPNPRVLCRDETILGSMFYIMDYVEGRVFWDPRLPGLSPSERAAIFASMNDTLAQVHRLDPARIGLADFGRSDNYLNRQIARWTRQYEASRTVHNPAMERLIEWLPRHVPAEHPARVVHGDFRLDNVLIDPVEPRVIAVLDWELSTIGNPVADFAYHMLSWHFAPALFRGLAGEDLAALGIPDAAAYRARYFASTGFAMPENWDFYIVLSMFRIAAILQGIARRAEEGNAANADAAEVGAKAVPIARLAWDMAQKIG